MIKVPEKIQNLDDSIKELSVHKSFEFAQKAVNSVIRLLGIEDEITWRTFTDTNGKIKSNAGWLMMAEGFADRRGAYKLNIDEKFNLDLKTYWTQKKTDKAKISMLVAITPNFEDEPFFSTKNVGIDFIIPEECDKIVIVLSKNYIIRTVELKDYLSETQKEILSKWLKITDFTNKPQLHEILWQSFDLESVNKQFYKGICEFFTELKQHLVSEKVFDSRHAAYFTNRLIGRMVFCRFLDKKGIISRERKYFETEGKPSTEYYREKLEVLFFKVFNTPIEDREVGADDKTPFLNGGLFEIKENDKYKDDKLTFPTDYFSRLFEFLKHYNFTTDESTSAFQQVAIDPEMLGKIFENLLAEQVEETGEQARKAKGAFYTPREIVDYMCKESLREYLKTQVTEARDRDDKISLLLDTKPHIWRDQQRNYQKDLEPFKTQIFDALDKAKILDPACGSGAFPMGMMQLLLMCYERLEPRFEAYKTKLNIIKNNLYGVDIEPMAVEISRLRAWLSIIVDKEGDIRKIEPLPNLDFKFVCANSLIPLDKSGQMNLMDDTDLEDKITALRDKYYDEKTVKGKNSLRKEFESLISAKEFGMEKSKKQEQLESYHPFDSENICQFFDPEFMFSQTGFDIVIGNPPYVGEKGNSSIFETLKKIPIWKDYYRRRSNTYYFFIKLGMCLLRQKGIQSLIIPKEFTTADWANKVRKAILFETKIINMVNFDNYKVFQDVGTSSFILTHIKEKKDKADVYYINFISISENSILKNELSAKNAIRYSSINFDLTGEKSWNFYQSNIEKRNKIVQLSNLFEISQGVVTGADKVTNSHIKSEMIDKSFLNRGIFVLKENTDIKSDKNDFYLRINDNWVKLQSEEKRVIKKFIKTENLNKWLISDSKMYIIYSQDGLIEGNVKRYLMQFSNILINRSTIKENKIITLDEFESFTKDDIKENYSSAGAVQKVMKSKKWWLPLYERRDIPFAIPKIIVNTKNMDKFTYSDSELIATGGGAGGQNFIYPKINSQIFFEQIKKITPISDYVKFVNGILNSKLIQKYIKDGHYNQLSVAKIGDLPVVKFNLANETDLKVYKKFINIIDRIISDLNGNPQHEVNTVMLENQIDIMVYKLYELTYDEVKIIDPEFEKIISQADYEKMEIE